MEKKLMTDFKCKAPQYVDFDITELSSIDDYFNDRVSLWSHSNIKINEETVRLQDNDKKVNSKTENLKTPSNAAIENIKKDYRVTLLKTPSSPSKSLSTLTYESPDLEYAQPWLNQTLSSLISDMNALDLNSTSSKISVTPFNSHNFNNFIETSTPLIAVEKKLKTNEFVKNRIDESNSEALEYREVQSNEITTRLGLQEVKNSKIITQIECGQDAQQKTAKSSEYQDSNVNPAKAAGNSSDQIVPIIAIKSANNENTQMKMISDKPEPECSKEVTESFSNDSGKNTEKLDANHPEPAEDSKLDAHLKNTAAESSKFYSQAGASQQPEDKGRKTKIKKPGVLVNKARRQSNKFRRQSGKFVSMAEAMLKFQKGTPKRFRSTKRMIESEPLQAVLQASRKVTYPISPVLQYKSRCTRRIALNQQEKETSEINAAKGTGALKKITKTSSSNFNTRSTEVRDKSESTKNITTKNPAGKIPATATTSMKVKTLSGQPKKPMKTDSETIPMKITSLNTKTKSSLSESVPKTTKKIGGPKSKTGVEKIASGVTKKLETKANAKSTCALSFEERNKLLLKKREEFTKRIIEQEKQMRIFHARPAPNFKPVTVHVKSSTTENSNFLLENRGNGRQLRTVHGVSTENKKIIHNHQNVKSPRTGNSNCGVENQENCPHLKTV